MERLKAALLARGLKCGGTLQQRAGLPVPRSRHHDRDAAARLFAAKADFPVNEASAGEALAKLNARFTDGMPRRADLTQSANKEIAHLEKLVYTLSEVLAVRGRAFERSC